MIIDATFWVTVSFFIFIGILVYFKLPQKIKKVLDDNILNIKNQINEAEKLKEDSKNILTEHEKKISNSKIEVDVMLNKANEEKDKIYKLLDYLNLKYIKSSTNFVFFESKKHINELSEQMLEKGVMVGRPFPPFYDWCRISTGTSEEVDVFIQAMLEVYG